MHVAAPELSSLQRIVGLKAAFQLHSTEVDSKA
jgi:hypothetical protein